MSRDGRFWVKPKRRITHTGPDRAVLLCRQSLTRGDTVSLEDQEEYNRRYAERNGYTVAGVHRSPNIKGWKEDRADHDAIRERAERGEIDVVISYDVSRTARTVRMMENFAHDLELLGCRLEFSAQEFANNPQVRQMMTAFAELDTSSRSVRLTSTWDFLQRRGRWHGVPPYGYRREEKRLVIDEVESTTVHMIFDAILAGKGTTAIVRDLIDQRIPTRNGGTWGQSHLSRVIRNPAYAGGMRIRGNAVFPPEGVTWHEPIITRDQWDRVQTIQPERGPAIRIKAVDSWLEGLIYHACGHRMYLINTGSPRGTLLSVYRCQNRYKHPRCAIIHGEVSMRNVEIAARAAFLADLATIDEPDRVRRRIAENARADGTTMARKRIQKAREALMARRERADEARLSGRRDLAWFVAKDDEVAAALRALDQEEAALPNLDHLARVDELADTLAAISQEARTLDPDLLGAALRALDATVVVGEGGVRIAYPDRIRAFIPTSTVVRIPRARTR